MKTIENHIEISPTLQDIKEILVWLKNERDRDILRHGFFNNKDIIMDSFRSGNTIVFKQENKSMLQRQFNNISKSSACSTNTNRPYNSSRN